MSFCPSRTCQSRKLLLWPRTFRTATPVHEENERISSMRKVRMRGCISIVTSLLTLALSVEAQSRDRDRLYLGMKNPACQPSEKATCGADMQIVQAALKSPFALWDFITSPDVGYFERLTAASRAGKVIPATWIPKLLAAQNELQKKSISMSLGFKDIRLARHPNTLGFHGTASAQG